LDIIPLKISDSFFSPEQWDLPSLYVTSAKNCICVTAD